jgi:hypothetical protein
MSSGDDRKRTEKNEIVVVGVLVAAAARGDEAPPSRSATRGDPSSAGFTSPSRSYCIFFFFLFFFDVLCGHALDTEPTGHVCYNNNIKQIRFFNMRRAVPTFFVFVGGGVVARVRARRRAGRVCCKQFDKHATGNINENDKTRKSKQRTTNNERRQQTTALAHLCRDRAPTSSRRDSASFRAAGVRRIRARKYGRTGLSRVRQQQQQQATTSCKRKTSREYRSRTRTS